MFNFDGIYVDEPENNNLYRNHVKRVVQSAMDGINGTVFAYGQTGSGKTHAIMGTRAYPGVVSMAVADMFAMVEDPDCEYEYSFRVRSHENNWKR